MKIPTDSDGSAATSKPRAKANNNQQQPMSQQPVIVTDNDQVTSDSYQQLANLLVPVTIKSV